MQQRSRRQTIEQQRARQAWEDVSEIKKLGEDNEGRKGNKDLVKKYRSIARGLNAMIQINGLGQTLAFHCAKAKDKDKDGKPKKNEHYYLSCHLTHWMKDHVPVRDKEAFQDPMKGFRNWVIASSTSTADYRRATTECLAFGIWLRRFAEAELEGDE